MSEKFHKKIDFFAQQGVKYTNIVFQLKRNNVGSYYFSEAQKIEHELKFNFETMGINPLFDVSGSPRDDSTREMNKRFGLDRYFKVKFFNDNVNSADYINGILHAIALFSSVETVYPSSEPISLRSGDIQDLSHAAKPIIYNETKSSVESDIPNFVSLQYYLWPARHCFNGFKLGGVDGAAGLAYEGGRGENVTIITNEPDAWFTGHKNLPQERAIVEGAVTVGNDDTASVGVMAGLELGYGILGIASRAKVGYAARGLQYLYNLYHRLKAGDVIQIGMQHQGGCMTYHNQGCYVPVEFEPAWFDMISALTTKGIHVIQAAGNGAVNLDHPAFNGKFNRNLQDSGAIIVGALDPRTGLRAAYSNFGSRLDSASWGDYVVTTAYGYATLLNQTNAWYINNYSGNSPANPIVAGVVACLSSIAIANKKSVSPIQFRELLTNTGTVLEENLSSIIGTQPDLGKAIYALFSDY
ncbi:S8 family serine peptidase [Acerihabitans arboris]|uniref:S8 family serine peptidase n=1 Tax=Acerihabitans arboris TaxID=2691583 RepID=A0A845SFA4_9GAMM|nr:S8 family serine peptidase [Acerihabitans arboris]NDL61311.1 S8 family serine peptidase [Acerihabitans arboris]